MPDSGKPDIVDGERLAEPFHIAPALRVQSQEMKVRQGAQGRNQTAETGLELIEDGLVPVSVARDLLHPALEVQTSTHERVRGRCLLLDEEHADTTRFNQIGGVGRKRAHEDVKVAVHL